MLHWNTWLSKAVYQSLTKKETARFLSLASDLSKDDSIEDISCLKEFRKRVEYGEKWFTRNENVTNSHCYGIWQSIFPFLDWRDASKYPVVEHGFIPARLFTDEIDKASRVSCVTFSDYRKEVIREKRNVPVFTVGPYIQYAEQFYDEEKRLAKKRGLGKTLLFFPGHSVNTASVSREMLSLLTQLEIIASNYETVLVCVFWWDLNSPTLKEYEDRGYKVVSAGYVNDPMFLSRLKTIISLSDAVSSDVLGTHAAYCWSLGKPFSLINCSTRYDTSDARLASDESFTLVESNITQAIGEASKRNNTLLNYYWGIDVKRPEKQRRMIADISSEITEITHGVIPLVPSAVRLLLNRYERVGNEEAYSLLRSSVVMSNMDELKNA